MHSFFVLREALTNFPSFQLSKHLVELDNDIGAPDWLEEQRLLDLTSLIHPESDIDPVTLRPKPIPTEEEAVLYNADVLQGFPSIPSSGMDESQMSACERMVTKKVSIVQGPPGTGKTFISVSTLRVMVRNMSADSPPIIIAAQTNHALDQLMNHVLAFEPNVLRLGGGSDKENMEIQKRTLYMLRMAAKDVPNGSRGMKTAFVALENRINEIEISMAPLVSEGILSVETLLREGIISASQKDSLYEEGWANGDQSGDKEASVPPLIACKCLLAHLKFPVMILIRRSQGLGLTNWFPFQELR
jgi:helicase required for RNAi-mediated heterochromatin assembly 1